MVEGGERNLPTLFGDLARELTTLLKQEVALARAELSEKVAALGKGVAAGALGAAVVFAGFLVLLAGAVIALAEIMPAWLSALLVGLIVTFAGAMLLRRSRQELKADNLAPTQTTESIKRDVRTIKGDM